MSIKKLFAIRGLLTQGVAIAVMTGVLLGAAGSQPALAAKCGKTSAGFQSWLEDFKAEARAKGISNKTLQRALSGVSYDRRVIKRDRSQHSFKLSFNQFYKRRVGSYLMKKARGKLAKHRRLLAGIEKRYGVPAEVLVSIWGLETNFGRDGAGKYSIIQAIATLAYDCRRSAFFKRHLHAAMRIVQRGDMSPKQMRGGWAGEIGQVQFLPASYDAYAVDYDGNGRRDLRRSVPDILASTANFLRAHGWKRGGSWDPGTANYAAIKEWNRANVYARTIAVMSNKLRK